MVLALRMENDQEMVAGESGCGVYFGGGHTLSFPNPSRNLNNGEGNTNNFAEAHAIERALQKAAEGMLLIELDPRTQCVEIRIL